MSALTGVHAHVRVELGDLVEGLAADAAHVVADAAVLLHVLAQRGVPPERLVALCTLQRLLARVQPEVDLGQINVNLVKKTPR